MQSMQDPSTPVGWTTEPDRDGVPLLWRRPYGDGVYRRAILLVNEPDLTWGELEDDYHHFRIQIHHDGRTVTRAEGRGVRGPWTTCFDAPDAITEMAGMPVGDSSTAIGRHLRARDNCTHLFDVAGLAAAHAGRDARTRRYDVEVNDRDETRSYRASLARDGELLLEWRFADEQLVEPDTWVGAPLRDGFIAWAEATCDPETAEAAIVLRRALDISQGRVMDLDVHERASDVGPVMEGKCYTFTSPRSTAGLRIRRSAHDFADHPESLLDHLDDNPR